MSSEKTDLARAGTMQVTAQEGQEFLNRKNKKTKLAKHTTMKGTAQEGKAYVDEHYEKCGDCAKRLVPDKVYMEKYHAHLKQENLDKAFGKRGKRAAKEEEGKVFLDKNLTEWKKPYLADHFEGEEEEDEEAAPPPPAKGKGKAKLAKHSTMKGTAKEAADLLGEDRPDPDAATRGQQKKLDEISSPPPAKKRKGAASLAKANTISKTLEEAKTLYGDIDLSGGRSLRKRPAAPKPAMKKAGTMVNTAKEGKAFLKRSKKGAGKKKADEEKNGDAE